MVSGSDAREDILDALSAGVHGYIVKSLPLNELVDKIRYILSGELYHRRDRGIEIAPVHGLRVGAQKMVGHG